MRSTILTLIAAPMLLGCPLRAATAQDAAPALTPATWNSSPLKYTFGTFEKPGVVSPTGETFLIDTRAAGGDDGSFGGIGFNDASFDFDASGYALGVTAKLNPENTAETFNVLLGDRDGKDTEPDTGAEDFLFTIATSEFNATEFTTFRLPLGSGTESLVQKSYGFQHDGDEEQNFGLFQMQIQVNHGAGESAGGLVIEVEKVELIPLESDPAE